MRLFFLSVLFFSVLSLQAQKPIELSLDSAVNYAIDQNKTLTSSKFSIDKYSQKIRETISK